MPLCREPWQSLYILRRGILPCCYGGAVLGEMEDYAAVWNGPEMQELRRYLSRGELAPYCLENPGCPIVQRALAQSGPAPAIPPHASAPAGGRGALLPASVDPAYRPRAADRKSALKFVLTLFPIPGKTQRFEVSANGEIARPAPFSIAL